MKKILLIITGSIAAYKSLDLIRLLKKAGYEVTPVMTKAAEEFVTPLVVAALSGSEVYRDLFSVDSESKMGHINLSRQNDLIILAPASADIIAKYAAGTADDLASTILLATNKPVIVAPAMNEKMWLNAITQKNIETLKNNGIKILTPETDILACGEYGAGKMTDVNNIFIEVENFFKTKKIFAEKKIIITAGATYEPLDPVRFIGNYSSGKQGIAIAQKFLDLGAEVHLIAANIKDYQSFPKKNISEVKTADEMLAAVNDNLDKTDIFISVAAVADFKPKNFSAEKIKKSGADFLLELTENIDILKTIGNSPNRPEIVVGFAAETNDLIAGAQKKLKEKNCDLIIANEINNGEIFGADYNKISVIDQNGQVDSFDKMSKKEVAEILAARIGELILKN
jgi:phosphopantothenoylcysteine decarboxylase/phosphopantothenate--cysteine ligase